MNRHKILIVDDEKISLRMTDHILSSEYDTVCASSGHEAIEIYRREKPDLVLSDLRMPEIDGFELQRRLQKEYDRTIPFMFMTADRRDETESRGFDIGALDYIRKPFRADVLLKRVANIFVNIEQIQGLKKAAVTDPMTGLLNKASSQEEIDIMCRESHGVLMMVDLDSFKAVNDLYGHDMGDKILIRFAEIIRSAIRSTDLAGRMGGDEFVVFCKNIVSEEVIAEKSSYINRELVKSAKEFMGEDMVIPLGVSIGCAFAPNEGKDFFTLFKKADKALYDVKQNGKHGYKVYAEKPLAKNRTDTELSSLTAAMMLMSERNISKGAMVLQPDQFKYIYQFANRMIINYKETIRVILFSVHITGDKSLEAVMESFTGIVKMSLRLCDVVTQYSNNQLMVLLLKIAASDVEVVTDRIMMNWEATDFCESCEVTYEVKLLE